MRAHSCGEGTCRWVCSAHRLMLSAGGSSARPGRGTREGNTGLQSPNDPGILCPRALATLGAVRGHLPSASASVPGVSAREVHSAASPGGRRSRPPGSTLPGARGRDRGRDRVPASRGSRRLRTGPGFAAAAAGGLDSRRGRAGRRLSPSDPAAEEGLAAGRSPGDRKEVGGRGGCDRLKWGPHESVWRLLGEAGGRFPHGYRIWARGNVGVPWEPEPGGVSRVGRLEPKAREGWRRAPCSSPSYN